MIKIHKKNTRLSIHTIVVLQLSSYTILRKRDTLSQGTNLTSPLLERNSWDGQYNISANSA